VEHDLLRTRTGRRRRTRVAAAVAIARVALGVSLSRGGPVDRPDRPGTDLAVQLDALRGANDLVRATRTEVGHDPALYPTAYGRLEAALPTARLGCPRTSVGPPAQKEVMSPARSLRTVVVLADAGCEAQARRLTEGADLVRQARQALREGELTVASDAVQAALASDRNIPQTFWDDLPALLEPCRDAEFPDLYADSPGGAASADATRAAYYLLA